MTSPTPLGRRLPGVPAIRAFRDLWALHEDHEAEGAIPGAFELVGRVGQTGFHGMLFVCPCGCGDLSFLRFRSAPDAATRPAWQWDGNENAPSLFPSIQRTIGCGWHGFLRGGLWMTA